MPFWGGYPIISSEILLGEVLSNNLPTMTNLKIYESRVRATLRVFSCWPCILKQGEKMSKHVDLVQRNDFGPK
jgi:hypothetical protein